MDEKTTDEALKQKLNIDDSKLLNAQHLFGQVIELCKEAQKKHGSYDVDMDGEEERKPESSTKINLCKKMSQMALKRQKAIPVHKVAKWVVLDQEQLNKLITDITTFVDALENVFPPRSSEKDLLAEEAAELREFAADLLPLLRKLGENGSSLDPKLEGALRRKEEKCRYGRNGESLGHQRRRGAVLRR